MGNAVETMFWPFNQVHDRTQKHRDDQHKKYENEENKFEKYFKENL